MQTFKGTHLSAPLRYEKEYSERKAIREPFFIIVSQGPSRCCGGILEADHRMRSCCVRACVRVD